MNVKLIPASEVEVGMYIQAADVWREVTELSGADDGAPSVWLAAGRVILSRDANTLVLVGIKDDETTAP